MRDASVAKNVVANVLKEGWMYNGRVLRAAEVAVGSKEIVVEQAVDVKEELVGGDTENRKLPAAAINYADCAFHTVPGSYSRFSPHSADFASASAVGKDTVRQTGAAAATAAA